MLKRQQVILTDWLVDYLKYAAQTMDWSFSETLRLLLCIEICAWAKAKHPTYKVKFPNKKIAVEFRKVQHTKQLEEVHHRIISEIYFEARKAAEFLMSEAKKTKKK